MIEDAELLRRYAEERSEEAFAELVRRHLDFVYGVALRQVGGDAHRAQDVAQEVFTTLARKAAPLARRPVLGGWLYRTAQFTAIDVVRVESRRQAREQKAEIMNEPASELEKADGDKLRSLLDQTMIELKDTDRDAVWLRFFAGLSFGEVGSRLRLTENGARMRVGRALEKMHAALSRRGVTSTTAALAAVLANQTGLAAPPGLAATVTSGALAGSVAGGTGAAVTFMSMSKLYSVAAAALAVTGAVFWHQQNVRALVLENTASLAKQNQEIARLRAENRRLASLSAQSSADLDAQAELGRLREENERLKSRAAAASAASETKSSATGTVAARAAAPTPVPVRPDAPPTSEVAQRAAQDRRLILRRYEPVFGQLGLSPEQREKLTLLLVDDREASVDFAAAAATTGEDVTQDHDLFSSSVAAQREQIRNQIKDVLGEENYARFQAADEGVRQSAVIERLQKSLKNTSSLLNPNQTDQLLEIMKDEQVTFVSESVVGRAGAFLSDPQVAALQRLQQQRQLGAQKKRVQQAVTQTPPANK